MSMARKDAELYLARTRVLEAIVIDQNVIIEDLLTALEGIASLIDGQAGRMAQDMMMHGFSPVKALSEARDLARIAITKAKP